MRVSREILPVLLPLAAIFLASLLPMYFKPPGNVFLSWNLWLALISLVACVWLFVFFRDPKIKVPVNPLVLLSPASGKVISVDKEGERTCVRIFMSIFDYHIQRAPCDGKIEKMEYIRGSFKNAASPGAHRENERNKIIIVSPDGIIEVTQIAGAIARRILAFREKGEFVKQGEKIGMIKFGSQVDCSFPAEKFVPLVKSGEKVKCAQTAIAKKNET